MDERDIRKQWYALQVKSRFEKVVAQHLRGKGLEEYLPLYRSRRVWSDRVKEIKLPLFPGYVFCKFNISDRLPVLTVPGIVSVVSFGGVARPVPDQEMNALQTVVQSGLQYEPWPGLCPKQMVMVRSGPLRGLEGQVVEVRDNCRLIISVNLLQRSVSVEIDRNCVKPLGGPSVELVTRQ